MPCKDVTELIQVVVDDDDRLASYRFIKRTCGQGVGADALLADQLCGQTVEHLLALDPETFAASLDVTEEVEEFLSLKHLIAVQSALEVLTGAASGGPDAICAAAEITCEPGETVIEARISVDLMTERIAACGNCGSCGSKRKKRERVVVFQ
ncbi:MAG: hypothetical protein GC168_13375 [Candidatus Hydrogenedens sp.]|nr:hypothetical protein [Candidatus Hydrogenedens sp.]